MAASSWFGGGRRDVISDENAARLIDALPAPAGALHSGDGTILYVNDALEEAFGAPRSQLLGQGIQHFHTDPGDGAALAEQLQGMGYVHDADVTWRRPNGTLMDVRLSARVTEIDGEPVAVFLVKDITAERAAEAEARRLREAIDNMNEGFVLYDSEERLVFSNKKYRALYPELATLALPGARREDIRRMFAESDAAAQMLDAYKDLVPELDADSGHRTGRATREVEFRRLDGINIKISDFQLSDGSIIGVRTDITDIRARDRHLRAIYENAFVGIALVDDQGRVVEANPTLYSMLGLAVDTPGVRCSDCISESDYAAFMVDMTELIAGNVPHIATALEFTRSDSTRFTARLRATRIFDDVGNAVYNLIFLVDITDMMNAEARLAESEARYRGLVEDQPAFVVRFNADGTMVFANRAYTEFLGISIDAVMRTNLFDLVPPEDHQSLRDDLAELVTNQTGTPRENRYLMPDGSVRWLQWTNRAIGSEPGAPMEYQGYGLDVTDAHIAADRLHESEAQLAEAQSIGHIGSWYRDIATDTLTYSTQLYSILGLDPTDGAPDIETYINLIHPDDRTSLGETIRRNMRAANTFSLDHRIIRPDGSMRVVDLRSEPVMDGNGEQIARRGTVQDITERVLQDRARSETEERLAQAQQVAGIGGWYRDLTTGKAEYTEQAFNILGGDIASKAPSFENYAAFLHPEDRDRFLTTVEQNNYRPEPYEQAYRILRGDTGEIRHIFQQSDPVFGPDGAVIARRGFIQDVTERHAAEEALRASQRQLQVITDSLPVMIAYVDTALCYQSVNKTYEDFFRLPRETIIGMSVNDLVEADVASEATRLFQIALAGTPTSTDITRIYPDGQTRDMSFSIIPDRHGDGTIGGIFLLGIDMTERKAAEDALRASQSEMRTVLDNVAATIAYLDTSLHYRFVNQALANLLGLVPEDMPGMSLHDVVSEQMFEQIKPWLDRAMAGEQVAFDIERTYPVTGARNINLSFVPDFDAANTVQGIYILGTDVTWRKTAEEKMRASDTRLRLVTDNLSVFIGYIDPHMRYQFVNQQYETTYGRPREEIIGMHVKDVIGPERFLLSEPYLRRGLAGEHVTAEVPWPFENKPPGRMLRTMVPDIGDDGEVLGIYVLAQELK